MVLPEGFVVPPWYYLVPLSVGLIGVVAMLWAIDPPVTDETVVSFAPWMMVGSSLHVLYRIDAVPPILEPLVATPSVYVTTAIVAGIVWTVGDLLYAAGVKRSVSRFVGFSGAIVFAVLAIAVLVLGFEAGSFNPLWPVVSVVGTVIVTAVAWIALSLWFTEVAAITRFSGALVVFSQALDGVSTAIGYDVLGAHEEVPLSRMILEAGSALPTAEYVGAGWLFVAVKVLIALVVVGLFAEYVRERPRRGRLLLAFVAAVGLGPGVHNVLLFTIS